MFQLAMIREYFLQAMTADRTTYVFFVFQYEMFSTNQAAMAISMQSYRSLPSHFTVARDWSFYDIASIKRRGRSALLGAVLQLRCTLGTFWYTKRYPGYVSVVPGATMTL